ncbi:hypothetical protein MSUIS_02930 [Mycoplasma suis KI3806]|uniref:Uncharacterized protein n=1 Tax=Mycoplasma suis (strain KI_3806) TaxID=708248 RepID=F0V3G4_MYCS3|nr:DUF3713 domain-containing protein [Mycoplasma suis]CBZ40386.1 hypothetical protein MSUIS_02930 [Mycoplasma suis KI3806]
MLSLFTLKKALFTAVVGTGVLAPVVATSPIVREIQHWNNDVSPLKEGLKDLTNINIYDQVSASKFLQKSLINSEAQEGLLESFVQELSKRWYLSQSSDWTYKQLKEWEAQHEEQFQNAWEKLKPKNPQRDFWDNYWGSKQSMNSFGLRFKSYELVKKFLTFVNRFDFKINSQQQWKHDSDNNTHIYKYFLSKGDFVYPSKIENKSNWDKTGFYPTRQHSRTEGSERMIWGKYDFLNWSYRKWFEETLPVYFWLISWNYNQNATEAELREKYDFSYLGNNAPARASYSFPIFSKETIEKFKSFLSKISKNGNGTHSSGDQLNLEKQYVPIWMGDQPQNGTLINIFNSFEKNSIGSALVSSYLVSKKINGNDSHQRGGSVSSEINKLTLKGNSSQNNFNDPISIFLENKSNLTLNKTIWFDSSIVKKNEKSANHIYDVRETDTKWTFFRDQRGVHAIKLDGEETWGSSNGKHLEELFKWFNFRNLQNIWNKKSSISLEKVISTSEDWVEKFSTYLDSNFNRLFAEFFITKSDKSPLFDSLRDKEYFKKYSDSLRKLLELQAEQKNYSKIIQLRRRIIEAYGEKDWELKTSWLLSSYAQSHLREGLTSPFAYNISSSGEERFPDQEKVFKISFEKNADVAKQVSADDSHSQKNNKYLEKLSAYYESVKTLLQDPQIDLRVRSDGFNIQDSQRVFLRDPIFDFLLDKLFSQKDFINYIVKEDKLLGDTNFFGSNKLFVKKGQEQPSTKTSWDDILKFNKNIPQLDLVKTSGSEAKPSNGQPCQLTDYWTKSNIERAEKSFESIMKKYLFRNYLRKIGDNYFNFWIEFPEFRDKNYVSGTEQKSLSDFQLFYIWQKNNLINIKEKNSLLDFLISLDYITKDKFRNLQNTLKNQLSDKSKYHYLLFELDKSKDSTTNRIASPFLQVSENYWGGFSDSKKDLKMSIRSQWKRGAEVNEDGSSLSDTSSSGKRKVSVILKTVKKNQDINPDGKENLFNFEKLDDLISYIKGINSFSRLEDLINRLYQIDSKIWPSFYRAESIYWSDNGQSGGTTTERKLYLEDKKNALIYQLKNMNQSLYASKIFSKEEIGKIFGDKNLTQTQPAAQAAQVSSSGSSDSNSGGGSSSSNSGGSSGGDSGGSSSTSSNGTNNESPLSQEFFKRKQGYSNGGYYIQISDSDFSSEEKLCSLFGMLPEEVLTELLIQETEEIINKERAEKNFFSNTYKLKPHDVKFKNHIDSRHLN